MTVTNIGNTADKIVISDNATPASGVYALYLPAESIRFKWPMKAITKEVVLNSAIVVKDYIADWLFGFKGARLVGSTHWQNFLKALAYWIKNDSKLYLSFVPDEFSSQNFALVPQYTDPTSTMDQYTGKLEGLEVTDIQAGTITFDINMPPDNQ